MGRTWRVSLHSLSFLLSQIVQKNKSKKNKKTKTATQKAGLVEFSFSLVFYLLFSLSLSLSRVIYRLSRALIPPISLSSLIYLVSLSLSDRSEPQRRGGHRRRRRDVDRRPRPRPARYRRLPCDLVSREGSSQRRSEGDPCEPGAAEDRRTRRRLVLGGRGRGRSRFFLSFFFFFFSFFFLAVVVVQGHVRREGCRREHSAAPGERRGEKERRCRVG